MSLDSSWSDVLFEGQYDRIDGKCIGEGTYGKVYKARHTTSGREVALKKMRMDLDLDAEDADEECFPCTYLREIALLKALSHPHIVELLDVFVCSKSVWLVFEFIDMDLKKFMRSIGGGRKKGLSPDLVKSFSLQLCRGIEHMHTKLDLIHRDLKPQNLLIAGQRTLKLADYGLAREHRLKENAPHRFTPEVVTIWYRAPELLLGSAVYNVTLDLWSIGCIIAEMALGSPIFEGMSELDTIFLIFRLLGTPTEATLPGVTSFPHFKGEFNVKFPMWPQRAWHENYPLISDKLGPHGIELVASFLVYDPRKRISARKAVQHEFFQTAETSVQRQLSRTHTPDQIRKCSRLAVGTPEKPNTNKAAVGDAAGDKKRSLVAVMFNNEGHSFDESIKYQRLD